MQTFIKSRSGITARDTKIIKTVPILKKPVGPQQRLKPGWEISTRWERLQCFAVPPDRDLSPKPSLIKSCFLYVVVLSLGVRKDPSCVSCPTLEGK